MGGIKTWATNDVLTASDLNTYVRDQVVAQVTSGSRPAGVEGQVIYETDTNLLYIHDGSGWVRFGASGGWTSWTPTLTQSSAVTKTVTYAKYEKVGRMVTCGFVLDVTGTGTAANNITVTLPFTATVANVFHGGGLIYDTSANLAYPAITVAATTTLIAFQAASATAGAGVLLGSGTFTAALAAGDSVRGSLTYEATT